MRSGQRSDDVVGFAGGASDFEGSDFSADGIGGLDLSVDAIRAVARRQLIGSVVVSLGVLAVVALMAMRPAYVDAASSHKIPGVRQPVYASLPGDRVAAIKQHGVELP